MLLLHNKDQQQNNHLATFATSSAGKGADMKELQAHQCVMPELWTWFLRSVSVIRENKLSLQELDQLIRI